jgi:hypothetical protein
MVDVVIHDPYSFPIRSVYSGDRTLTHTLTGPLVPFRPRVVLLSSLRQEISSVYAGPAGEIEFAGLAPGWYEVLVLGEGRYRSQVFGPIEVV